MAIPPAVRPPDSRGGMGNGERDNALRDQKFLRGDWTPEQLNAVTGLSPDEIEVYEALVKDAAEEIRSQRHPNSQRFHQLLKEAGELHDSKQSDYGRGNDPFANVRASEEWGIDGWVGAMVRAQDKVRRLQTFAQRGSLVNESVKDSLLDLAVYSLIALVLFEEQQTLDRLRSCRHIYEVDGCGPCDDHKKESA